MKRGVILLFLIGLVLFSFGVGGEESQWDPNNEIEGCGYYKAPCSVECGWFWSGGCTMTGNDICSGNSDGFNYCLITKEEDPLCDVSKHFCEDEENWVLCCSHDPELVYELKNWCEGPSEGDANVQENITFDGGIGVETWTDSCVEGNPNIVRENVCEPTIIGGGCSPTQQLILSVNRRCPDNTPYCDGGKCVGCRTGHNEDCGEGEVCTANNCVDEVVVDACDGESCTESCILHCGSLDKYCL